MPPGIIQSAVPTNIMIFSVRCDFSSLLRHSDYRAGNIKIYALLGKLVRQGNMDAAAKIT